MGVIFNNSQFIDVVEYLGDNRQIIWKFERERNEIKHGARLIVRPGQAAILVVRGQLADVFGPGHYVLKTKNLPILSTLIAMPFGFNSPIKSDVFFVNTTQFLGMKWETSAPILRRDPEMGIVRLSAAGKFAFQVMDPKVFLETVHGAQKLDNTSQVSNYLSSFIGEAVSQCLGEIQVSVLDLAMNFRNMSQIVTKYAQSKAAKLGISISEAVIENIKLPSEVEKLIDEQSGIGLASRNMESFMQYQTARAMRDAAKQQGGLAGVGAGFIFGQQITQSIASRQPASSPQQTGPVPAAPAYPPQPSYAAPQQTGSVPAAPAYPSQPSYAAPQQTGSVPAAPGYPPQSSYAAPQPAPTPGYPPKPAYTAPQQTRPTPVPSYPPKPAAPARSVPATRPGNPAPASQAGRRSAPPVQSSMPKIPKLVLPSFVNPLRKGQKTPLQSSARQLKACFGWNVKDDRCDIDVSAFLVGANNLVPGDDWFVFYGHEVSPDQSVVFKTDSSGKDREIIQVDLSRLNPRIQRIVFVMTINEAFENNLNFSMIQNAYFRLLDAGTNRELMSYQVEDLYSSVTSLTIGELYLHNGQWKCNPVGNGVHQDLAGQCRIYGVNLE